MINKLVKNKKSLYNNRLVKVHYIMNKRELGFFQVVGYFILFALLGTLTWANLFALNNTYSLVVMSSVWAVVIGSAVILRLFAVRMSWFSAIETAWLSLLVFSWLLVFLDFGLCGFSSQPLCQPANLSLFGSGEELTTVTYSLLIFSIVMSALCFPWGLPLLYLWLQVLPPIFTLANLPAPDYFSPLGRFVLFFPALLMAPLGYWFWFLLVPRLIRNTMLALRVPQIIQSASLFGSTTKKKTVALAQNLKGLTKKFSGLFKKKDAENEDSKAPKALNQKKPGAKK